MLFTKLPIYYKNDNARQYILCYYVTIEVARIATAQRDFLLLWLKRPLYFFRVLFHWGNRKLQSIAKIGGHYESLQRTTKTTTKSKLLYIIYILYKNQ